MINPDISKILEFIQQKNKEQVDIETYTRISLRIFEESKLLEDREYDKWIELLDSSFEYIVLNRELKDKRENHNSIITTPIIYDGIETIKIKLTRLKMYEAWSDNPPSKVKYFITNILAYKFLSGILVRSSVQLIKYRTTDTNMITYDRVDILNNQLKLQKRVIIPDTSVFNIQDLTYIL